LKYKSWALLVALAVFLISEIVVIQLSKAEHASLTENNRYLALQELATRRARLEGLLNNNLIALRVLRAEIAAHSDLTTGQFQRIASTLLSDDLHTIHVALAPDLVITDVYPLEGNESIVGVDYRELGDQFDTVQHAISSGGILITGPIELVQGGTALIARVPVYLSSGVLWGMMAQVIDHQRLFQDAGLLREHSWNINIHTREYNQPALDPAGLATEYGIEPAFVEVNVPGTRWALSATPHSGSWVDNTTPVYMTFVSGTLIAAFLGMMTFLLVSNQARLRNALSTISLQARYDSLTELPNRDFAIQQLSEQINKSRQKGEPFCLLFIDLDHFKEVNDSLGHHVGDEMLKIVSKRLTNSVREEDIVARLGGDEFIVILKNCTDPMAAERCASNILKNLMNPINLRNQRLLTSGSIGIAVYPNDGEDSASLLQAADMAMYAAKNAGRGLSFFYNTELQEKAHQYVNLSQEIITGLENEEFELHYQPIVDAYTERVVCVEGLLRWFHPDRGLIMPDQFIAVAEKTGAIREIGNYILKRACRDFPALKEAGLKTRISLNCSPHEFYDEEAVLNWQTVLRENNVPPDMVEFEITESMLMPDKERQRILLREIAESGVSLVVDDFGTGYSSASYLQNFPISKIKIDQSFLVGAPQDHKQKALVDALIRMAHALDMVAVAEGVETKEQAEFLREVGCDLLQGFLFDKALPLDELLIKYRRK